MNTEKQKILLMAGIVFGAILILWLLIFLPTNKSMKRLRNELNKVQADIDKVEKMKGENESLDVLIGKYNDRLRQFQIKLPSREESTLRDLGLLANKMGIEIVSMIPSAAVDSKVPIEVFGCKIKELYVTMQVNASYMDLGDYLLVIRDKLPAFVKLNELNIEKKAGENGKVKLTAVIKLTLFMLFPV